jgi:Ca2+-transporting ATPase
MGISGTEFGKDASSIILLDDNFDSIITAIFWGRNLYANIQRFVQY